MKLEKVRATQQEIEQFKKQQAEWRRLEQERMEAENRRIMEFMNLKELDEESRTAKIREREEAMDRIQKRVETIFLNVFICLLKDTHLQEAAEFTPLCSVPAV